MSYYSEMQEKINTESQKIELLISQANEWAKCKDDIVYFANTYCKYVDLNLGLQTIQLYDWQKEYLNVCSDNDFVCLLKARQVGGTLSSATHMLHYITFNDEKSVALLANKSDTAREILSRIKLMYDNLPNFLKVSTVFNNVNTFELINGCRIIASSTSSYTNRGFSISYLYIDECAWAITKDFYKSTYPTIVSGKNIKVILASSFLKDSLFESIYNDAVRGLNQFTPMKVDWTAIPNRDEEWKRQMIANTSEEVFTQEHECEYNATFVGSTLE